MSILNQHHESKRELTDSLTVLSFCTLVTAVAISVVIANIHLLF